MKVIQSIAYLLLFLFLVVDTSSADSSTNIMRGVTYYFGTENLGGKLVFLVCLLYTSSHPERIRNPQSAIRNWICSGS